MTVSNINIAGDVYRQPRRGPELRITAYAIGKTLQKTPGQRTHCTVRCDFSNAFILVISDENISGGIYSDPARCVEFGSSSNALCDPDSATGYGGNGSGRCNLADAVIRRIGHINIAGSIQRHASGTIKLSIDSITVVGTG